MGESILNELPHSEIIIDKSIVLRQLQAEDATKLFDLVDHDRKYLGQFMTWVNTINSPQDIEDFIGEMLLKRHQELTFGYGIFVDGQLAGHASLMHINDGEDPEVGYWIADSMSGKGITTKVASALVDLGLKQLGLDHVVIKCDPQNIASNRIAEKLGAVLSGQEHDPRIGEGKANIWLIK